MFSFRRLIRDYFGFSKTQTNGFMVLMPMLLIILILPTLYHNLTPKTYDKFENDGVKLDSLVALWSKIIKPAEVNSVVIKLRAFDPNLSSVEELIELGFYRSLAERLDNYRNAGGKFKAKSDMKKIYGMPDSLYLALAPFIQITAPAEVKKEVAQKQSDVNRTNKYSIKETNEPVSIAADVILLDVNSADTTAFQKLRGIGPAYSKRIVKYRNALGGFVEVEQIKEVYGISDTLFNEISTQLYLEQAVIKKVSINLATFKELNSHPYISFEQTKEILNLKSKNGKFKSLDDLKKLILYDSIQLRKLLPYLKF
jgi:competence protein ComEA